MPDRFNRRGLLRQSSLAVAGIASFHAEEEVTAWTPHWRRGTPKKVLILFRRPLGGGNPLQGAIPRQGFD
jgi:hypothetical protein